MPVTGSLSSSIAEYTERSFNQIDRQFFRVVVNPLFCIGFQRIGSSGNVLKLCKKVPELAAFLEHVHHFNGSDGSLCPFVTSLGPSPLNGLLNCVCCENTK